MQNCSIRLLGNLMENTEGSAEVCRTGGRKVFPLGIEAMISCASTIKRNYMV